MGLTRRNVFRAVSEHGAKGGAGTDPGRAAALRRTPRGGREAFGHQQNDAVSQDGTLRHRVIRKGGIDGKGWSGGGVAAPSFFWGRHRWGGGALGKDQPAASSLSTSIRCWFLASCTATTSLPVQSKKPLPVFMPSSPAATRSASSGRGFFVSSRRG